MSVLPMANVVCEWKRSTAYVLNPVAVVASHTPDRQPVREATVQVRVTGTPTGTVTVNGTVDGGSDSEILTWAGATGYRVTAKRFTAITTIATSLSGAVNVEAKALGADGSPETALYTVRGPGHPVTMEQVTEGRSWARRQGDQEEETVRFLVQYEEIWKPRKNDRVVVQGDDATYEVQRVSTKYGGLNVSHWTVKARRLDDKGTP